VSIPDRLLNISKAYLNQIRDRIDDELTEREQAMDELEGKKTTPMKPVGSDADDLMRRAEEKIAAVQREVEAREQLRPKSATVPAPTTSTTTAEASTGIESDYTFLGVPVGSDLATIQAKYEEITRRCDVNRFPDGSPERAKAKEILERAHASYEAICRRLDPTQNRFGKLEL
jgi:hypothetical protein